MKSRMKLIIDCYSGLGGASQAFKKSDKWEVITVDINPNFNPTYCCDMRDFLDLYLKHDGRKPDFIWFSPPCTEFSKSQKPWFNFMKPSKEALTLVLICFEIVRVLEPRFWILENVIGLQRWIGKAKHHIGSFYFWGYFPFEELKLPHSVGKKPLYNSAKEAFSCEKEERAMLRSKIPYEISLAVRCILEKYLDKK